MMLASIIYMCPPLEATTHYSWKINHTQLKLLKQFCGCACKISYGNGYTNIPVHHMDDMIYCLV